MLFMKQDTPGSFHWYQISVKRALWCVPPHKRHPYIICSSAYLGRALWINGLWYSKLTCFGLNMYAEWLLGHRWHPEHVCVPRRVLEVELMAQLVAYYSWSDHTCWHLSPYFSLLFSRKSKRLPVGSTLFYQTSRMNWVNNIFALAASYEGNDFNLICQTYHEIPVAIVSPLLIIAKCLHKGIISLWQPRYCHASSSSGETRRESAKLHLPTACYKVMHARLALKQFCVAKA